MGSHEPESESHCVVFRPGDAGGRKLITEPSGVPGRSQDFVGSVIGIIATLDLPCYIGILGCQATVLRSRDGRQHY